MSKSIILLSALFFLNSCIGMNKTTDNSSKVTQKKEITQVDTLESSESTESIKTNSIVENGEVETEIIKMIEATDSVESSFNHSLWNELLQKHVSVQGSVNYKGFKADHSALEKYFQLLSNNTPDDSWAKDEKLAYWINAYNAYTIKLIIDKYPVKTIKDIIGPWDKSFIKLGKKLYSLNDIEHKILRKMNEPRIHFAIVCASVSCPKLQITAFESANLEAQLTNATKEFLKDPVRNNLTENNIKISKIFKWFSSDFKQNGSLIDFLNKYSEITISQNASKRYKDYDWNLNE